MRPRKRRQVEQEDNDSESGGDDRQAAFIKRLRHAQDNDEEFAIGQDEDEEISSDEDELRVPTKARREQIEEPDIDLDEDSDDGSDEGSIDLAAVLDAGMFMPKPAPKPRVRSEAADNSQAESHDSDNDDDDDEHDGSHARLLHHLTALSSKPEQDTQPVDARDRSRKRARKEQNELFAESEFRAPGLREQAGEQALSLDDLLSGLSPAQRVSMAKQLKDIAPSGQKDKASIESGVGKKHAGPLAAPLPALHQAKIDRTVAKESLDSAIRKWDETTSKVRGIQTRKGVTGESSRLVLPLEAPKSTDPRLTKLQSAGKPFTALESSVQAFMQEKGLSSKSLQEDESARLENLPADEARQRTAEIRRARELMFRMERKATRIAKIKSKTFRKLQKKSALREAARAGEEAEIASDDEEERERLEVQRARERATLRHTADKRSGGAWARGIGQYDDGNSNVVQAARSERADREAELRQRIRSAVQGEQSGDSDTDGESDHALIRSRAAAKAQALAQSDEAPPREEGLMGMDFMRRGAARKEKEVQAQVADLQKELAEADSDGVEDSFVTALEPSTRVDGNVGRLSFRPAPSSSSKRTSTLSKPVAGKISSNEVAEPGNAAAPLVQRGEEQQIEENPWLALGKDRHSRGQAKKERPSGQASPEERSKAKLKKTTSKSKTSVAAQAEEDTVIIDPTKAMTAAEHEGEDSLPVLTQRDLVADAFANDHVIANFAADKAREIEADAPFEEDTTLPGWGSWGGKAAKKKSVKKTFVKKHEGVAAEDRKDAKLKHVIISERTDKKANKYALKDLPYPYTSAAQLEHKLAQPLGPEWVTRTIQKQVTMPSVLVRPGVVVQPVSKYM
ncbi:uncharacterized protein L969DRAFT_26806 [Mixia osmundae IAM 14324]|uniref:Uncharacterized protein n=1 Tax=Mixia osmundae (strain CBS 9802 / IAM 14324 / JCM 22182 / KY 12970) TaxID=764103 RepID=G7E4E7_MIXOS|nr:uncharacterized protein L969DRAFT_26806 [Mixia osmundae IAM 14324]KEI36277.1 hypothetical protein L969DRAFT_26806 [Mixia osmundae IAM 14324]GAA97707.1 hypothetical protein E5Q_04385 [Mixia osmundae IAM 14324]